MKYVERRPGPALRPHVECVWAVWDVGGGALSRQLLRAERLRTLLAPE